MRTSAVAFITLALTATASAESPDDGQEHPPASGILTASGMLMTHAFAQVGGAFEATLRFASPHLYAHGLVAGGRSAVTPYSDGSFVLVRLGVEGRACVEGEWVCTFAGLDLGVEHDRFTGEYPVMEGDFGTLTVPRVGIEAGQEVRLRVALEAPYYEGTDNQRKELGWGATAGLGYAY
jgi:hypothetical protein